MLIPTQKNLYSSSMSMISLSDVNVEDVKTRFEGFQRDGVINSDCKFDDPVWHTTDEYSNVGLHFKFNLFSYSNNYQQIFSLPFEGFVVSVKAFILSIMGRNALSSIQTVLLDLRHVIDGQTALSQQNPYICQSGPCLKVRSIPPLSTFPVLQVI